MAQSFAYTVHPYVRAADQDGREPAHHPVVVAGGGLVGLAVAVDLAQRGVPVVVLDEGQSVSVGSRSICVAKRTLEIFDRLGIGGRCVDKGVTWNRGRVFRGERELYAFDLLPEPGHRRPAFVNLQQYYVETFLIERLAALQAGAIRWRNRVVEVIPADDHVALAVETPDGPYRLACDWLLAADGVRSTVRDRLGLPFVGETFRDRFLITDVVMASDRPTERWFWFDPPFHDGRSALLHKQPDNVWRIDLQLGPDADREVELAPERILPRLRAMLGADVSFTIDWASVYTFQCRRLERFRHGRVLFAGDAAHTVSPFGARGGNGGVQDADNLAWKLAAVIRGDAPAALLDSYDAERVPAADANILNSTRATDFIAPKHAAARLFRDAVLDLAVAHPFARALVNSGRLSLPHAYAASPIDTPDAGDFAAGPGPGAPAVDAPTGTGGLLDALRGDATLLLDDTGADVSGRPIRVLRLDHEIGDPTGLVRRRYDLRPGTAYLFRPDQHVAARFRAITPGALAAAYDRMMGRGVP